MAKGKQQRWQMRQAAEFAIAELATIRIGRGKEDRALDELAEHCAELERIYAERMGKAGADSIDELVQRRHERESILKEIKRHRDALAGLAPSGLPAFEAELARLKRDQEAIRKRRPSSPAGRPMPRSWIGSRAILPGANRAWWPNRRRRRRRMPMRSRYSPRRRKASAA